MDEPPSETRISVTSESESYPSSDAVHPQDSLRSLESFAQAICAALGVGGYELNIQLVDGPTIRKLNYQHRAKDQETDVLSFPQNEWVTPLTIGNSPKSSAASPYPVLGDIAIGIPKAIENASKIGQGLDREIRFLIVHGILHLCGHDHEDAKQEREMLALQQTLCERFLEKAL